jgi:transposase-like protein
MRLRCGSPGLALPLSGGGLTGATLDFYLSESHDAAAAKCFFRKALAADHHPRPRVINVDSNPAYPKVVQELKQEGKLGRRCRCRTCLYLNNIAEQDHRAIQTMPNRDSGPFGEPGEPSQATKCCR